MNDEEQLRELVKTVHDLQEDYDTLNLAFRKHVGADKSDLAGVHDMGANSTADNFDVQFDKLKNCVGWLRRPEWEAHKDMGARTVWADTIEELISRVLELETSTK